MKARISLWIKKFRAWRQNRKEIKNVVHNIGQLLEEFELWMLCYHRLLRSQLVDTGSSHKYLGLLKDNPVIVKKGEEIFDAFLRHKGYFYKNIGTDAAKLFHEHLDIRRPIINKLSIEAIQQVECKSLLKLYVKHSLVGKGDPALEHLDKLFQTDPKYHVALSKFFSLPERNNQ
jgi:hypothetical protein